MNLKVVTVKILLKADLTYKEKLKHFYHVERSFVIEKMDDQTGYQIIKIFDELSTVWKPMMK